MFYIDIELCVSPQGNNTERANIHVLRRKKETSLTISVYDIDYLHCYRTKQTNYIQLFQ